ncbi:sialidase family protein [Nonomuraea sp. SYSU D8015]|uniref:sialidase family protein n=1 Tax=Nonomuraea sp. SYSU D8015 TaxID=2593644 RepID=UPI00166052ED|nr:sialidase family protein [Nonomuraea sp. SYSU D8015]
MTLFVAASFLTAAPAAADVPLAEIGADAYANATSQHGTQAGPDTYHWGTTIVAAQQAGRFFDGGASGIAFATSGDNGSTWTKGVLPGITGFGGGPYQRVSDPSVAYDARHDTWLIASLGITDTSGITGAAVLVSRSADGGRTWDRPVTVAEAGGGDLDKSWIVCDNTPDSPYYGRCHVAFDDNAAGNAIMMARSSDGGLTWAATATSATGLGGQPVVRPDGAVVVPYLGNDHRIRAFRSRDGGATWSDGEPIAMVQRHTVAGGLRALPLPSAETDAAGTVYVVWHDCRFQLYCAANDIVLATSADGAEWDFVTRVTGDGGDHFIPGLGVDRSTSGGSARLALAYYRYPDADCTAATCRLTVAYTSSANGGRSWSAPEQVHGPMELGWLANTAQGRMAGDYISTSVVPGGNAFPAFAVAAPPAGGAFDMRTYTVSGGLPIEGGGPALLSIEAPIATGEDPPALPLTAR